MKKTTLTSCPMPARTNSRAASVIPFIILVMALFTLLTNTVPAFGQITNGDESDCATTLIDTCISTGVEIRYNVPDYQVGCLNICLGKNYTLLPNLGDFSATAYKIIHNGHSTFLPTSYLSEYYTNGVYFTPATTGKYYLVQFYIDTRTHDTIFCDSGCVQVTQNTMTAGITLSPKMQCAYPIVPVTITIPDDLGSRHGWHFDTSCFSIISDSVVNIGTLQEPKWDTIKMMVLPKGIGCCHFCVTTYSCCGTITVCDTFCVEHVTLTVTGDTTGCPGDVKTWRFNASGGKGPYTFVVDGGSPIVISGGYMTYHYTLGTATTATIMVKDAYGCTQTITRHINFSPSYTTAPAVTGAHSNCDNSARYYSITNASIYPAGTVFTWSLVGGGTLTPTTGTGTTVTFAGTPNWLVIATATVPGYCGTISDTIIVYGCCNTGGQGDTAYYPHNIYDTIHSSSIWRGTSAFVGGLKHLYIYGTLVINNNITFSNCNIRFGPYARVNVNSGKTLTITTGSYLQACQIMWQGIELLNNSGPSYMVVSPGSSANRNTIRDALTALQVNPGCVYTINYGRFYKDYNGINVVENNIPNASTVVKTQFSGGNPIDGITLPYLPGSGYAIPMSQYGVKLTTVNGITVGTFGSGNQNQFDTLLSGIQAYSTIATINNNIFTHIRDNGYTWAPMVFPPLNIATGTAIYFNNYAYGGNNPVVNFNTIFDATIGLHINYGRFITVTNNTFDNSIDPAWQGFTFTIVINNTSGGSGNLIQGNTIKNAFRGIFVYNTVLRPYLDIDGNTINHTPLGSSSSSSIYTAIGIYSVGGSPVIRGEIKNNIINYFHNGIVLVNVSGNLGFTPALSVHDNSIDFDDVTGVSAIRRRGILLQGCNFIDVYNNVVRAKNWAGSLPGSLAPMQYVRLIGTWVENTTGSLIHANRYFNMGSGVLSLLNCGADKFYCNKFVTCYSAFRFGNTSLGYTSATIGNQLPGGIASSNNFKDGTTLASAWYLNGAITLPVKTWTYSTRRAEDKIPSTKNNVSFISLSSGDLDTCGQPNGPSLPHTADSLRISMIGGVLADTPVTTGYISSTAFMSDMRAYQALADSPALVATGGSTDPQFNYLYNTWGTGDIGKFYQVVQDIASGSISAAIAVNGTVAGAAPYTASRKTVNNIFLNNTPGVPYTGANRHTLVSIAGQNPLTHGDASYMASILIDSFQVLPDSLGSFKNDANGNKGIITATTIPLYKLFPNPATNILTVQYDNNFDAELTIYDLSGRPIDKVLLPASNKTISIDVSRFSSGIFMYHIASDGFSQNNKIAIVR